jgi:hypothetical protein
LINTWWDVTNSTWLPGELLCYYVIVTVTLMDVHVPHNILLVAVCWLATCCRCCLAPAGPNGTLEATWGGMGDLAYEYMLKTWVLSGGRDKVRFFANILCCTRRRCNLAVEYMLKTWVLSGGRDTV